ncbi:MAG: MFS transporter, partial [Candidatus Gracilibacteria bacterium]
DEKERTSNLGLVGAVFGIGFILGPGLGALLSTYSMSFPFWIAMGLSLANAISAYFFLPESNLHKDASRKLSINPFKGLKKAFASPTIAYLLVIWFLYTMSFGSMQTIFSLFTHMAYNISASWNGVLLASIGVITAFNQGFLLKHFWLKRFNERRLEIGAAAVAFVSYGMILSQNFTLFLIAMVMMSFANALIRVVNTSEIAGSAKKEERGEIVGVIQSVMFLSAILSPLLGGVAITQNVFAPWALCAAYMAIALVLLLLRHRKTMRVNVAISKELPL